MPNSIYAAVFFVSSAMAAAPLPPGELSEVLCLYAVDATSCESSYRRAEKSSDAAVFARVGCEDAKSAPACAHWGEALARDGAPDASVAAAYEKGCADDSGLGCLRLIERMNAAASTPNPARPAEPYDAARVDRLVARVCDPRGGIEGQCVSAKKMQEDLRRRGDSSLAPCQVEIQMFGSAGVTGKTQILPDVNLRSIPKSRDECVRECAKTVDAQQSSDPTDLALRGRCKWGATFLPEALWKPLGATARCPNDSQALGTSSDQLYRRCRCENPIYGPANKIAEPFGAYVRAEVAYAKKFGRETWYRCGAAVVFDDEANLTAPTCPDRVKDLRKRLTAEPTLKGLVLNFQGATCKGAKK